MKRRSLCKLGLVCALLAALFLYCLTRVEELSRESARAWMQREVVHLQERLAQSCPVIEEKEILVVMIDTEGTGFDQEVVDSVLEQHYSSYRLVCLTSKTGSDQVGSHSWRHSIEESRAQVISTHTLQSLYEVLHQASPRSIVVVLDGNEKLLHRNVLTDLNQIYANPEVWAGCARSILEPGYCEITTASYVRLLPSESGQLRDCDLCLNGGLKSCLAALFQEIKLQDLLIEGEFMPLTCSLAWWLPVVEMGAEHLLEIEELMSIQHLKDGADREQERLAERLHHLTPYDKCDYLQLDPISDLCGQGCDALILSEDRPLHLQACLEALFNQVSPFERVFVVYRASEPAFERAYLNLRRFFPTVIFLDTCADEDRFEQRLQKRTLTSRMQLVCEPLLGRAPHLLVLSDTDLICRPLRIGNAIEQLKRSGAIALLLDDCLEEELSDLSPLMIEWDPSFKMMEGVRGVQGVGRFSTWSYLCRKELFLDQGSSWCWHEMEHGREALPNGVMLIASEPYVLCSKPDATLSLHQKRRLSRCLIEGFKIDLPSLLDDPSPIGGGDYPLIRHSLICRERDRVRPFRERQ